MNIKDQNITQKPEHREKQAHFQKYRGNSLLILEELEHSGGLTTRQISDAILGNARVIAVTIQRLVHRCVILITIPRSSAAVGTGQSNIFKRGYTFYIDGRIEACKPLCV